MFKPRASTHHKQGVVAVMRLRPASLQDQTGVVLTARLKGTTHCADEGFDQHPVANRLRPGEVGGP